MLVLFLSLPSTVEDGSCVPGIEFVPLDSDTTPPGDFRFHSHINCAGSSYEALQALNARVPLQYIRTGETSELKDTPLYNTPETARPESGCFRAVLDNFVSKDEAELMLELVTSLLEREGEWEGQVATVSVSPSFLDATQRLLLTRLTARVHALLEEKLDVTLRTDPYIIARTERPEDERGGDGGLAQAQRADRAEARRRSFRHGLFNMSWPCEHCAPTDALPIRAFLPHIDSAFMPHVAYTVLLHLVAGPVVGGETCFIDAVSEQGTPQRTPSRRLIIWRRNEMPGGPAERADVRCRLLLQGS